MLLSRLKYAVHILRALSSRLQKDKCYRSLLFANNFNNRTNPIQQHTIFVIHVSLHHTINTPVRGRQCVYLEHNLHASLCHPPPPNVCEVSPSPDSVHHEVLPADTSGTLGHHVDCNKQTRFYCMR